MARTRHVRQRQCGQKRRYPTEEEAARACRSMTLVWGNLYATYRCTWCKYWHIGHARSRQSLVAGGKSLLA